MPQIITDLIPSLRHSLNIELPDNISMELLKEILSMHFNHLIQDDFEKLVALLYRIDVSEAKLKKMMNDNREVNAGSIIADLIIERQQQKIESRKSSNNSKDISDEEKW